MEINNITIDGVIKLHMSCGEIIELDEEDTRSLLNELISLRKQLKGFLNASSLDMTEEQKVELINELLSAGATS